jgi:hypothetical protein
VVLRWASREARPCRRDTTAAAARTIHGVRPPADVESACGWGSRAAWRALGWRGSREDGGVHTRRRDDHTYVGGGTRERQLRHHGRDSVDVADAARTRRDVEDRVAVIVAVLGRRERASSVVVGVGVAVIAVVRPGGRLLVRQVAVRHSVRECERGSREAHEQADEQGREAEEGRLTHAES